MRVQRMHCAAAATAAATLAAALALVAATASAAPAGGTLSFLPGWDDTTQPLNYRASWVRWSTSRRTLTVRYHLVGSVPGSAHQVGFHLFPRRPSECRKSFGTFPLTSCDAVSRQNVTVPHLQAVDVGAVGIDAKGNGDRTFVVRGVAPGAYRVQFGVRVADCTNCAYIHQAPGPFGRVLTIGVPG